MKNRPTAHLISTLSILKIVEARKSTLASDDAKKVDKEATLRGNAHGIQHTKPIQSNSIPPKCIERQQYFTLYTRLQNSILPLL